MSCIFVLRLPVQPVLGLVGKAASTPFRFLPRLEQLASSLGFYSFKVHSLTPLVFDYTGPSTISTLDGFRFRWNFHTHTVLVVTYTCTCNSSHQIHWTEVLHLLIVFSWCPTRLRDLRLVLSCYYCGSTLVARFYGASLRSPLVLGLWVRFTITHKNNQPLLMDHHIISC